MFVFVERENFFIKYLRLVRGLQVPAPCQPLPHPPAGHSPSTWGSSQMKVPLPPSRVTQPCGRHLGQMRPGVLAGTLQPPSQDGRAALPGLPSPPEPCCVCKAPLTPAHPALTPFTGRDADARRGHVTGPASRSHDGQSRTLCTGSEPHAQWAGGEGWGRPWSSHPHGPLKVTSLMSAHWWRTLRPGEGTRLRSHSETGQLQDQSWVST